MFGSVDYVTAHILQFMLSTEEKAEISLLMVNMRCKNEDIPFGKECSNKWILPNENGATVTDTSVSMECKPEGIIAYIKIFNTPN